MKSSQKDKVLKVLTLALGAFMSLLNLGQWFLVSELELIELYTFGENTTQAYFYKTAELFALVHLYWAYLFLTILGLTAISIWLKKRVLVILNLVLVILATLAFLYHSSIGAQ